jgi:hypothetical protein
MWPVVEALNDYEQHMDERLFFMWPFVQGLIEVL